MSCRDTFIMVKRPESDVCVVEATTPLPPKPRADENDLCYLKFNAVEVMNMFSAYSWNSKN